ncbi:hypothetical protein [Amycolatopsis magusensis]|uniref:LPXTG-motif cell wall anchor domain-containing protein n=1 Tax=Amycolatopsis magusensis TaxID=882444 RepID=A0ABS4PQ85_9PSEU|nr:hypothetical protein [Amycolatopsis magusensis]MBP2181582.1 hypothetical protein [Amycolatopsis magusensis]
MTRLVTKLAAGTTALAFAVVPGVASAQVDEETGPVAYANAAAAKVGEGEGAGTVVTETQKSPLKAGQSKLGPERNLLPKDEGEKKAIGSNYLIHLGKYNPDASPYPADVDSRDHNVVATLKDTNVPTATAETNYALQDVTLGGKTDLENTFLALDGAKSTVECAAPDKLTGSTTAEAIWVRTQPTGDLEKVEPDADGKVELTGLPFGPPSDKTAEGEDTSATTKTVSDLTLRPITEFDSLLRQEQWRSGELNSSAGWLVEIVSHVTNTAGVVVADVKSRYVLGGVSCSIPKNFTPADPQSSTPQVPTKIPAGVTAPADSDGVSPLGLSLLGGGVLLGAGAVLTLRRRPAPVERKS